MEKLARDLFEGVMFPVKLFQRKVSISSGLNGKKPEEKDRLACV